MIRKRLTGSLIALAVSTASGGFADGTSITELTAEADAAATCRSDVATRLLAAHAAFANGRHGAAARLFACTDASGLEVWARSTAARLAARPSPLARYLHADALTRLGDQHADALFTEVIKDARADVRLRELSRYARAIAALSRNPADEDALGEVLTQAQAGNADAQVTLGFIDVFYGNADDGERRFRTALAGGPENNGGAWVGLAMVAVLRGESPQEALSNSHPEQPGYALALALDGATADVTDALRAGSFGSRSQIGIGPLGIHASSTIWGHDQFGGLQAVAVEDANLHVSATDAPFPAVLTLAYPTTALEEKP